MAEKRKSNGPQFKARPFFFFAANGRQKKGGDVRRRRICLAVLLSLALVPLQVAANPDPIIEVTPMYFDFGEVAIGDVAVTGLTISNTGGHDLVVFNMGFYNGGAAHYDIIGQSAPFAVAPGASVDFEVAFRPDVLGELTARVVINSNAGNAPRIEARFIGTGIGGSLTIDDILDFIDEAVDQGSLDGTGPCAAARRAKLRVFTRALARAGQLHDAGRDGLACWMLIWALLRSDGVGRPRDFVAGEALQELNDMLVWLLADWGCQ